MYLRNAAAIGILTILATARAAEVSKGPFEPESPADAAAIASAKRTLDAFGHPAQEFIEVLRPYPAVQPQNETVPSTLTVA